MNKRVRRTASDDCNRLMVYNIWQNQLESGTDEIAMSDRL